MPDYPIRKKSARGVPKADNITRSCYRCGACFLALAPGKTGERGLWSCDMRWYCSIECAPSPLVAHATREAAADPAGEA